MDDNNVNTKKHEKGGVEAQLADDCGKGGAKCGLVGIQANRKKKRKRATSEAGNDARSDRT